LARQFLFFFLALSANVVNGWMYLMAIFKKYVNCLKLRNRIPRLTVRGIINNASNGQGKNFDWCDALIDAVIISGLAFFSTLGGGAVAGINSGHAIEAATVAAFSQFFVFLALKRGLMQNKETKSI
jgi:hypothetical protein